MDVEERVRRLQAAVDGLTRRVQMEAEPLLYEAASPDDWTAMRVLAHVAEILPYWSRQAADVAARNENNQPFGRTADDPDRIAWGETHADDALAGVLPRIDAGLDEAITTMRSLPAEAWEGKTAKHPRRGEMTIAQIFDDFVIAHCEEHLNQAQRTLEDLHR
jgi:hypothetical protein